MSGTEDVLTDRGFRHAPEREGTYGGFARVYESSAASAPHVWVLARDHNGIEAAVHLTVETARAFAADIDRP